MEGRSAQIIAGLTVGIGFFLLNLAIKKATRNLSKNGSAEKTQSLTLFSDLLRIGVLAIGWLVMLRVMGIVGTPIFSGFSFAGLVIVFAFREGFVNIWAGAMIRLHHSFHTGDHISAAGLEGEITRLDLRYSTLKAGTKSFLIPNSVLWIDGVQLDKKPKIFWHTSS
jgi:small-conductance mechanosensitive channel